MAERKNGSNISEQFNNALSQVFCFCRDKIPEKGEDSILVNVRADRGDGICGVFDGCGGSGSRVYEEYGGHTGAYIASRVISETMNEWYETWDTDSGAEVDAEEMKAQIDKRLKEFDYFSRGETKLRGLARDFPSTAALFVFRYSEKEKGLVADVVWAGDSRVYILDSAGLHQLTTDDVKSGNPMLNLRTGNIMSNVVSASGKYELHRKRFRLSGKAIVFAATDGCFEYVPSPMHFEDLLLNTLESAGSLNEWKKLLMTELGKRTGDDMSMAGIFVNFKDFAECKKNYRHRRKNLEETYIQTFDTLTEEEQFALWDEYKTGYLPGDEN